MTPKGSTCDFLAILHSSLMLDQQEFTTQYIFYYLCVVLSDIGKQLTVLETNHKSRI